MSFAESALGVYRDRLDQETCYTELNESVKAGLEYDLRRYGLNTVDKVAHGILVCCMDEDEPLCVPWLVSPTAPEKSLFGGRHGLVTREFNDVAERANLTSYTAREKSQLAFDDVISTFVIKDRSNEALFTVLCDTADLGNTTFEQVELIADLSHRLPDHQIFMALRENGEPRAFAKIKEGKRVELDYGFQRGLQLETIARPDDFVGRARELDSYASYSAKHGLDQWEFLALAERAIKAFREQRPVGLDALCREIISER